MRERFGRALQVAAIGPAGERGVRYATLSHDGRHAGRGGLGAVLGAKNVKAVAVRPRTKVAPADPAGVLAAAKDLRTRSFGAGHREVPRARHAGQPAGVQRHRDPAHPQLPGGHLRRCARPSPRRSWPSCAAPPATAAPPARSAASTSTSSPARRQADAGGVRERLRARPDVRGVRPRRRARGERPVRRAGHRHDLGGRHHRLGDGVRRAGLLDAPWLRFGDGAALLRALDEIGTRHRARAAARRRARGGPPSRGRPGLGRLRPARQGPGAARLRAAHAAGDGARAWPSTPAAPTTTGPAPTRPTWAATSTGSTAAPAHVAAAVETEDRAAVMDSLILCKFLRGVFTDPFAEWAQLLSAGHRLGRRRRRAARDRPPDRAGQARLQPPRGLAARGRLAAGPAARRDRWSWAPGAPPRLTAERLRAMVDGYYAARGLDPSGCPPGSTAATLPAVRRSEGDHVTTTAHCRRPTPRPSTLTIDGQALTVRRGHDDLDRPRATPASTSRCCATTSAATRSGSAGCAWSTSAAGCSPRPACGRARTA